jgi:hypothetical protein
MANDGKADSGLMCGGICVVAGIMAMLGNTVSPEPVRNSIIWSVRLQSSGTSSDVIQSLNEQTVREVVKALNEAIMNLNV